MNEQLTMIDELREMLERVLGERQECWCRSRIGYICPNCFTTAEANALIKKARKMCDPS